MKSFIYFISIISLIFFNDLKETRKLYGQLTKKDSGEEFIEHVNKFKNSSNETLKGYYAASVFLQAKNQKKIKDKKQFLKEGKVILEELIEKNPSNLELKLIRLSIQENLPKIVGYNNINFDKNLIINGFKNCDNELKEYIKKFVNQSKSFSKKEKELF